MIKDLLEYHPESGSFSWKVVTSNRVKVGDKAGSRLKNGYRIIRVQGKIIYEHRLVWWFETGNWPNKLIKKRH